MAGACSAYPMRPLVCRAHYVTSAPHLCGPSALPAGPLAILVGDEARGLLQLAPAEEAAPEQTIQPPQNPDESGSN